MFTVCSVQLPPFRMFKAGEPKEFVERERESPASCAVLFPWCDGMPSCIFVVSHGLREGIKVLCRPSNPLTCYS